VIKDLRAGDPVAVGPYKLLGRLGAGGTGQVYLAKSPGGRLVAIKLIRPELAEERGFRTRFAGEIAAALRVRVQAALPADPRAVGQLARLAREIVPSRRLPLLREAAAVTAALDESLRHPPAIPAGTSRDSGDAEDSREKEAVTGDRG